MSYTYEPENTKMMKEFHMNRFILFILCMLSYNIQGAVNLQKDQKDERLRQCLQNFLDGPSACKREISRLIDAGANTDVVSPTGLGVLYYIVRNGDVALTEKLLEKGARVNDCVPHDIQHVLQFCPNIEIMELLFKYGAKAKTCLAHIEECYFTCNYTPLMLDCVIRMGADVNIKTEVHGYLGFKTPLRSVSYICKRARSLQMMALLLRAGARDQVLLNGMTVQDECLDMARERRVSPLFDWGPDAKAERKRDEKMAIHHEKRARFIGLYYPGAPLREIIIRKIVERAYSIHDQERAEAVTMIDVINTDSRLIESRAPIALVYDSTPMPKYDDLIVPRTCYTCKRFVRKRR